jgi:hypothetical protein
MGFFDFFDKDDEIRFEDIPESTKTPIGEIIDPALSASVSDHSTLDKVAPEMIVQSASDNSNAVPVGQDLSQALASVEKNMGSLPVAPVQKSVSPEALSSSITPQDNIPSIEGTGDNLNSVAQTAGISHSEPLIPQSEPVDKQTATQEGDVNNLESLRATLEKNAKDDQNKTGDGHAFQGEVNPRILKESNVEKFDNLSSQVTGLLNNYKDEVFGNRGQTQVPSTEAVTSFGDLSRNLKFPSTSNETTTVLPTTSADTKTTTE